MLRNSFFFTSALAAGILGFTSIGCGDDSVTTGSGGGGGSGATGGTGAGAGDVELNKPPTRPEGAPPGETGTVTTLGVSALYLGDVDRAGTPSPKAWEGFGYDLDNVATVDIDGDDKVTGADLEGRNCSPVQSEANAGNLEDGDRGVDNSFGRNILPFLGSFLEDASAQATSAIEEGSFTLALEMNGVGSGADYDGIPTALFAAIDRDEDGVWRLVPELLNPDGSSKIQFPNAFVTGNTWVSGEPQTITLSLSISGIDLSLSINSAVIAVDLDGSRTVGTNGVIAGVLDTTEFVEELGSVAAEIAGGSAEGLCPGEPLFESVVQTIRNASDIMKDGTQAPGQTCNGISIALGFDAATIELGEPAEPAGTGGGSACAP